MYFWLTIHLIWKAIKDPGHYQKEHNLTDSKSQTHVGFKV